MVTGGDGEIIHNLSYEAYGKATDKLGNPLNTSTNDISFASKGAEGVITDPKTGLQLIPEIGWYAADKIYFLASKPANYLGRFLNYFDPVHSEVKIHVRINDVADAYYQPQKMPSNERYNDEFGNFSEEIYMDKQKNIKIRLEDGTYVYQKDFGYIIDDTIDNPSNCHGLVQGGTLKLEISTNPKEEDKENVMTESEKIFNTPSYKRIIYNSYNYGGLHSLLSLILFPITIPKPESFKPGDVLYWGGHSSMVYSVNNGNVMMIDKNGDDGLIWLIKLKWLTNYAYGPEFKHYRPTGIPLKVVFNLPMGSYTVYIHPHQLLLNRYGRDCK